MNASLFWHSFYAVLVLCGAYFLVSIGTMPIYDLAVRTVSIWFLACLVLYFLSFVIDWLADSPTWGR